MTIEEEMAAAQAAYKQHGPVCTVCAWIATQDDPAAWRRGITTFGPKAAWTVMADHGFAGALHTVKAHKQKGHS